MLISEKVIRVFARSLLFENSESIDLNEINFSPSNGGIGLGANDQWKTNRSFHDKPTKMTDWQDNEKQNKLDNKNLIDVNNSSSSSIDYTNIDNVKNSSCSNPNDFKLKVNLEIDNIGLDVDNDDLDDALMKITNVIKGMI